MPMKNPNHPGDIIRDCLDELGVNVMEGAKALGVTRTALSRLINRKAGVSVEMALRLEKAIGSTAGFWLRLQLNYDLAQIRTQSGKIRARRLGTPARLALCYAQPGAGLETRCRRGRPPHGL
jgi:addiction module HigA family antidote